jgi:rare lipoprotein A (peptidoglycan hydrolase)
MLLLGLAWVASSATVDLPIAALTEQSQSETKSAIGPVAQTPRAIARPSPQELQPQVIPASFPRSGTLGQGQSSGRSGGLGSVLGASLFPSWLSSQGSIFDFTQPIAQWLTTISWFGGGSTQATKGGDCVLALPEASTSGKAVDPQRLQPWLEQCMLREISDPDRIQGYVSSIQAGLAPKDWNPEDILPTLVQNEPAIQVKGRILAVVPQAIASATSVENNEVLATEWMNQLRLALGAPPLNLVESQVAMHNLEDSGESMEGVASWYGPYFHGRQTATGEIFDSGQFTAAHKDLPFDTYLKITNTKTGKQLIVRINDRGPYIDGRDVDLSHGAAEYLGSEDSGVVPFTAEMMRAKDTLQVRLDGPTVQVDRDVAEPETLPSEASPITMLP